MEKMSDFFAARVDMYDEHMLQDVEGCKEGYRKMAELLSQDTKRLLDLGCGTGLELDEIFKRFPELEVTGIDLTKEMLQKLRQKHPDKNLNLIHRSYFDCDFGAYRYDAAVSFQTMHHFDHQKKTVLYQKIHDALKDGGRYIECDYMVETQREEDHWFSENRRIRKELGIPLDEFYHYDTPCAVANQIKMLLKAGFSQAEMVYRQENTTMLVAYR